MATAALPLEPIMVTPPPVPVAAILTPVSVPPFLPEKVRIPAELAVLEVEASPMIVIASAAVLADVINVPSVCPSPVR